MNTSSTQSDANYKVIGLADILRFFFRYKLIIFSSSIICLAIAVATAFLMTPIYKSTVLLAPVEEGSEDTR